MSDPSHFDTAQFIKDYADAAALQAAVVARPFHRLDQRLDGMDRRLDGMDRRLDGMDRRLIRIERVLAEVFPDAYRNASHNGDEPAGDGDW